MATAVAGVVATPVPAAATHVSPSFVLEWGSSGSGDGQFLGAHSVAVSGDGYVYVTDSSAVNNRVEKFDSSGNFVLAFGTPGWGDGQFDHPGGVAVDASGNVFVADMFHHRIQKFDSDGNFILKWGSFGSSDSQFRNPTGVAIDGSGNVFVADSDNNRIQKFDNAGNFVAKWGTSGTGDSQFDYPYGVAVDGSGNVLVADSRNHRIQTFDNTGIFVSTWGTYGTGGGQFDNPTGLGVDGAGNVYVADYSNNRMEKFDNAGNFLTEWGTLGTGPGQFHGPGGVAVDGSANVFVADHYNNRIERFEPTATETPPPFLLQWGTPGSGDGQFNRPSQVAVDGLGYVYVADSMNDRVQKFDNAGNYVSQLSGFANGIGVDNLRYPTAVAIDESGNIFVADYDNNRVVKFDSNGDFVSEWDSPTPAGLAIDESGNVYVTDFANNRVQKFDNAGTFLLTWGSTGSGVGQFIEPAGVAVDGSGNVFVADQHNARIEKFDSAGNFESEWGVFGAANGQFAGPYGVAVDGSGNVYVVDAFSPSDGTSNHRVEKFDNDGNFLTKWGSFGWGDGEFNFPFGVAVDGSGNVYVTDSLNRVQVFGVAPALGVSGLVPDSRARGVSHNVVSITGSGFVSGATVTIPGGGVTVHSTAFVDAMHLSVDVSVTNSAALGARDVVVTNPGSPIETTTCVACFTVTAKPTITSLTPSSRGQGATFQDVVISGTGLEPDATVSFSGAGIVVNWQSWGGVSLLVNVSVSEDAVVGSRSVTVANPDGGVFTKLDAFTVNKKPTVMSVSPAIALQGKILNVQIFGSGFAANFVSAGGSVSFGESVTVNSVTRSSASKLIANITVSGVAAPTARDVTVTNPDRGAGTCSGCFMVDDNTPPEASIGDVAVVEGNSLTKTVKVTVTFSHPALFAGSFKYRTVNDTAVAPGDYTAKALTTASFAAGATSKTLTFTIKGDTVNEGDEHFHVVLSNPVKITLVDTSATVTIVNDDTPPVASIGDVSTYEGNSLTKTVKVTVTFDHAAPVAGSFKFQTVNDTAVAPGDYTARALTTASFAAGATSKTLTFTIKGDTVDEGDEHFYVVVSNPVNITFADTSATVTIANDDYCFSC